MSSLTFTVPSNGHTVTRSFVQAWAALFGIFYFAYVGAWGAAAAWFGAGVVYTFLLTGAPVGVVLVVMVFVAAAQAYHAEGTVRNASLSKGWVEAIPK